MHLIAIYATTFGKVKITLQATSHLSSQVLIILCIIIHQIFLLVDDWCKRVTWPNIPRLKLGNIRGYSPIFNTARVAKKIWRIINTIAFIWHEKMLGCLSLDIISSLKLTVFLELRSQKTVRFSEQIMSADKYPSIFSHQMEAIVYLSPWGVLLISSDRDDWTEANIKPPKNP